MPSPAIPTRRTGGPVTRGSEEYRDGSREKRGVQDDVAAGDAPLAVDAAQDVLALAIEDVLRDIDPRLVDLEVRGDLDTVAAIVVDQDVGDQVARQRWRLLGVGQVGLEALHAHGEERAALVDQ